MTFLANSFSIEHETLSLLEKSSDLISEDQMKFISNACKGNPKLLDNCLSVLDCQIDDDDFNSMVYRDLEYKDESDKLIGKTIGNYTVEKKIGSGGAADVYRVYRGDGIHHQPLALKIVRGWGNTRELTERMKLERTILSQFKHPNIASFLDGGNVDDGRPYFVLEYVQGKPITEYCNEKGLSLRDRLALFLKVCSAVSTAHEKRTLHRDLKPSNILVTDEGVPKLLDFGIAKILDEESDSHTQLTKHFSPMTPQYASPEQINQKPLSTASDQYSLGVLLYELMANVLPYSYFCKKSTQGLSDELIKTPSEGSAFKKNGKELRTNSFTRQLKGDLDAIIMKAIHYDVINRYSSVNEFAEDIQRHLNGESILARKNNYWNEIKRLINKKNIHLSFLIGLLCVTSFSLGCRW